MSHKLDRFQPPGIEPEPKVVTECHWCNSDIQEGQEGVYHEINMDYDFCDQDCFRRYVISKAPEYVDRFFDDLYDLLVDNCEVEVITIKAD